MLRGKIKVMVEKDGEYFESILGERDCISVPPGLYRGEANIGEEDAIIMVMIGLAKTRDADLSARPSARESKARLTRRSAADLCLERVGCHEADDGRARERALAKCSPSFNRLRATSVESAP